MINAEISKKVSDLKQNIENINQIMAELYTGYGVEIRISYNDRTNRGDGTVPNIELWKAIEHVDYLKEGS